jgi:hypothetical protein
MNDRTFNHIRNLIKSYINEDGGGIGVPPTTHVSPETLGGPLDEPPIDFRKNKYKKLPDPYKALFRRGSNVQKERKS